MTVAIDLADLLVLWRAINPKAPDPQSAVEGHESGERQEGAS